LCGGPDEIGHRVAGRMLAAGAGELLRTDTAPAGEPA
jgi:hypothetical protein